MREIKFSCMWTDGESWMDLRYTLDQMENGMHWEEMSDNPMLRKFKLKHKRQFTGLKDRNGVEIYESDIVTHVNGWTGVIVWNQEDCSFISESIIDRSDTAWLAPDIQEVIGNIYQDSHLMERNGRKATAWSGE